jgi:acyl carrier protein
MIRSVLQDSGDLAVPVASLSVHADLYAAGLSSFGTVEIMVALEDRLGTSFPERLLTRDTFRSIASLCTVAEQLQGAAGPAAGAQHDAAVTLRG